MSKNLHRLVLSYFEDSMTKHSKVEKFSLISDSSDYLYCIKRTSGLSDVIVHLSDEYRYSIYNYYARPRLLKNSGFILVARPEATFDVTIISIATNDLVGIGKIAKLMGALHLEKYWTYEEPNSDPR